MTGSTGPIPPGDDSLRGEGNFFGIAIKDSTIFVTSNGDDTKGWISKSVVAKGRPGPLSPFIASKVETGVDGPTGAAFSPEGKLLVCQFGEINIPGDGLLVFYDPETGAMESKLKTGLNDLAGVAYSPKTRKLYGVDFSWVAPQKGGLFLLEPSDTKAKATRIAPLDKPSALAFAPDGTLYVTVVGTRDESAGDKAAPPGTIVIFKDL
jgi:DNA-binding beta-propeller fold protein YncE